MAITETQDAVRGGEGTVAPASASIFLPTADEDERLRGLIRAELERQRARPVALRTLTLIAEGSAEPTAEAPGYRVVDRRGRTRRRPVGEGEGEPGAPTEPRPLTEPRPFTLADLVDELRARHPELFAPPPEPEPEPVPVPPAEPARDTLADVKAAGARFVGTQSALARSYAARSAERGRTLAATATGALTDWRTGLAARLAPRPVGGPGEGRGPTEAPETQAAGPLRGEGTPLDAGLSARMGGLLATMPWATLPGAAAPGGDAGSGGGPFLAAYAARGRGGLRRLVERARGAGSPADAWADLDDGGRRRTVYLGLGTLTLAAVALALAIAPRDARGPVTPPPDATQAPTAQAPAAPPAQARDSEPVPPPEPETKSAEAPARGPGDVAGVPEVIDTATLRVAGTLVHLFGVEWVRGGQAGELTRYLSGRAVTCQPAPGSAAYLCGVDGRDLSEVVLFNGGGRASSEATPDLVAAEDHARTERLGVWKR